MELDATPRVSAPVHTDSGAFFICLPALLRNDLEVLVGDSFVCVLEKVFDGSHKLAHLALQSHYVVGYGVGVLYSIVLVSLDNIQEELENPYDATGEDDLRLDITRTYSSVMEDREA
ncbi:MAG: hypothetical protein ACE5OR_03160 [bacterium]